MNVRELLDDLEECNEEATVSCIVQSEKDASLYDTVVIRTESEEKSVYIIVMDINDKGITVRQLKNELNSYKATLPVCIQVNKLKPVRFPYQVNGIEDKGDIIYLKLPTLRAGLFEE
jgi:hypothetical protein